MSRTDRIVALKALRERYVEDFVRALESKDLDAEKAREQVKARIDSINYVLKELSASWTARARQLGIVAMIVGVIVTVLAVWPMHSVPFTLKVFASAVDLTSGANGAVEEISLRPPVRVAGMNRVESGLLENSSRSTHGGALILAGGVRLTSASLPENSVLTLASGARSFSLTTQGAGRGLADQLEVSGANVSIRDESAPEAVPAWIHGDFEAVAEPVIFYRDPTPAGRGPAPLSSLILRAAGVAAPAQIVGLTPTSLRFVERTSAAGNKSPFKTSVLSGELTIVSTGSRYALSPDDTVELSGIRSDRCDVSISDRLEIQASGSATGLRIVRSGFERSVKPSVLEFASSNHRLAALWGGVVFLWGLLWSTWRLLKGESA